MGALMRALLIAILAALTGCQSLPPPVSYTPPTDEHQYRRVEPPTQSIPALSEVHMVVNGWTITMAAYPFYDGGTQLSYVALTWPSHHIPEKLWPWLYQWPVFGTQQINLYDWLVQCGLRYERGIYHGELRLVIYGARTSLQRCLPKLLVLASQPSVSPTVFKRIQRDIKVSRLLRQTLDKSAITEAMERLLLRPTHHNDLVAYSEDEPGAIQALLSSVMQQPPNIDLVTDDISAWQTWWQQAFAAHVTQAVTKPEPSATHTLKKLPPGYYFLPRSGAKQAEIRIVTPLSTASDVQSAQAAAEILRIILGNSLDGRLGRDLRERLGLTYWIDVEIRNLKAHRLLIIATQGEHRKMRALIQGSQYHLQQLFEQTKVSKDEFEHAKSVYLWHQLMRQNTPHNRLLSIVDQRHHEANWRWVAKLSYAQFIDWLHVWQTAPTYIFVSGEKKALQHYLCEYFTPCYFVK